jgi:hypothetical protein
MWGVRVTKQVGYRDISMECLVLFISNQKEILVWWRGRAGTIPYSSRSKLALLK